MGLASLIVNDCELRAIARTTTSEIQYYAEVEPEHTVHAHRHRHRHDHRSRDHRALRPAETVTTIGLVALSTDQ